MVGSDRQYYYINDPDSAAMLRWDREQLENHDPYIVKVVG